MIKIEIDGNTYTEEEFKRDIVRMLDSLRTREIEGESRCCCVFVKCGTCPLHDTCIQREGFKYFSFETIEKVYNWAKEHPVYTNRDKLVETFGNKNFNFILSSLRNDMIDEYGKWLHEEYKEPKEESEE